MDEKSQDLRKFIVVASAILSPVSQAMGLFISAPAAISSTVLLAQCIRLVRIPRHDLWVASAGLGVLLLALSSLVESRKTAVGRLFARVRTHFANEAP